MYKINSWLNWSVPFFHQIFSFCCLLKLSYDTNLRPNLTSQFGTTFTFPLTFSPYITAKVHSDLFSYQTHIFFSISHFALLRSLACLAMEPNTMASFDDEVKLKTKTTNMEACFVILPNAKSNYVSWMQHRHSSFSAKICRICSDEVKDGDNGQKFVACHVCAFPVCKPCYEYERSNGNKCCPQCSTPYKRHKGKK